MPKNEKSNWFQVIAIFKLDSMFLFGFMVISGMIF